VPAAARKGLRALPEASEFCPGFDGAKPSITSLLEGTAPSVPSMRLTGLRFPPDAKNHQKSLKNGQKVPQNGEKCPKTAKIR